MAREEADREDLLADATAYVQRIAWQVGEPPESWFAGFRRDGAPSFYFGADPVYHFTVDGALRRAFVAGELFKAENGQLVRLQRRRSAEEVTLFSSPLTKDEQDAFLANLEELLTTLQQQLSTGELPIAGQVPTDVDVAGQVLTWLAERTSRRIADSPRAEGK